MPAFFGPVLLAIQEDLFLIRPVPNLVIASGFHTGDSTQSWLVYFVQTVYVFDHASPPADRAIFPRVPYHDSVSYLQPAFQAPVRHCSFLAFVQRLPARFFRTAVTVARDRSHGAYTRSLQFLRLPPLALFLGWGFQEALRGDVVRKCDLLPGAFLKFGAKGFCWFLGGHGLTPPRFANSHLFSGVGHSVVAMHQNCSGACGSSPPVSLQKMQKSSGLQ
jgi:hypothetical protein